MNPSLTVRGLFSYQKKATTVADWVIVLFKTRALRDPMLPVQVVPYEENIWPKWWLHDENADIIPEGGGNNVSDKIDQLSLKLNTIEYQYNLKSKCSLILVYQLANLSDFEDSWVIFRNFLGSEKED